MQEEEVCLKENDEKMNKYLAEMDGYVESLEKNYQNVEKEIETLGNKNLLNFNEISWTRIRQIFHEKIRNIPV